jgi:2-oxoglutarate dehydrogenase E2 component (dihydrolipoamide succinyltransferase)
MQLPILVFSHVNTTTMLSRSLRAAAVAGLRNSARPAFAPLRFRQLRGYADKIVKVPQMAESISEGTLKQWSKGVGDYVEADEEIATIETDKIDVAVNAPEAGTIKEFLVKEEDTVTVGQDIVRLDTDGSPSDSAKESSEDKAKESESKDAGKEEKEDKPAPKKDEEGKGGEGKPTAGGEAKADSKPAPPKEESKPKTSESKDKPAQQAQPSKESSSSGSSSGGGASMGNRVERRVKMNRMRLRTAERLKQSQNTAASLTTFNEVDMSSVLEFRKLYKDDILKKHGVKIGFMGFFARACIEAGKDIPVINAAIEGPGSGDTIVFREYTDISVAVATEKGLVTPIVRNAEGMSLLEIEKAIAEAAKKVSLSTLSVSLRLKSVANRTTIQARDNKLTMEDITGGTFTISNGGVYGSMMGTPIINLPQAAVLGLHAIIERPVVVNGKIEIRPMMYLALTYDHRLLDGREAVQFLVKVKEYIQDPRRLVL